MPHRFAETPNLPVSDNNWQTQKSTISKTAVKQSSGRVSVTGHNKLARSDRCGPDSRKQVEKTTPTGKMKSDDPSYEASFSDQRAWLLMLPDRPDFYSSGPSKEIDAFEYAVIFSTGKPFNSSEPFCVSSRLRFENRFPSAIPRRRPPDPAFTAAARGP